MIKTADTSSLSPGNKTKEYISMSFMSQLLQFVCDEMMDSYISGAGFNYNQLESIGTNYVVNLHKVETQV